MPSKPKSSLHIRGQQNRRGKGYAERMTNRGERLWIGGSVLEYDLPKREPIERPVKPAKK